MFIWGNKVMRTVYRKRITSGQTDSASLDFCLAVGTTPLMVSFFDRSLLTLKAIGASYNARGAYMRLIGGDSDGNGLYPNGEYDFYSTHVEGYDPFYHGIVVAKNLHEKFLMTTKGREADDFYSFLMRNYDLPLMKEWADVLWKWATTSVCRDQSGVLYTAEPSEKKMIPLPDGREIALEDLDVYQVNLSPDVLENAVSALLRTNAIKIAGSPQRKLEFKNMDEYFNRYGTKIVQNLKDQLDPLTEYDGEVDDFTLKHKRLYPQQVAMVNGATALLTGVGNKRERRKNHSRYVILNEGMGTGKTIQGASICEAISVAGSLRKGSDLKTVYLDKDVVKYRNIVMCPPHLVEKWAEEVKSEIPYANAVILDTFEDVVGLWEKGAKRTGKDFYIMSKDFAKLSYSEKPVPTKVKRGKLKYRVCNDCGREVSGLICSCGSVSWKTLASEKEVRGLACPNCNSILVPYTGATEDEDGPVTLMPKDFETKRNMNSYCLFCSEPLWQPYARNLGCMERGKWRKISHYANMAKKGKKTHWVHEDFLEEFLHRHSIEPNEYSYVKGEGTRRYDPATFIKKHMKNFFDVAIFDEVHTLKGGDTAQGHAMHALVKASKRQLALTGTIAGGCAHHLFYTLFRLDPARMRKEGFSWSGVNRFSEMYGSVETVYEAKPSYTGEYNVNSRGKKLTEPKVMPGISPLIFTKFLLDKAVMLDITDMSSHLPALHENVVLVDAVDADEVQAQREYNRIVKFLKDKSVSGMGMSVLSTMLQFSLSFLDKPYGVDPILDPFTGTMLVKVPSFDKFSDVSNLLAKEQKLVELVSSELSEGRNCFVYAEYTNSPQTCITHRLKDVLMHHVGLKDNEVVILDSTTVEAAKREAWIHDKAEGGMKVCIVNPRCVETGIDFCFKHKGVVYNYPSIIFYQLGYSLFTIWQASRRHYRLNQKEECRTYYMAYAGTVQEVVISLIAEKMAATSAIQGKFSADGLTAMAHGVDTRVRLAQALSNMDSETGKELQSMFDVINDVTDSEDDSKYTPMLLLSELIGEEEALERTVEEMDDSFDIFDLLDEGIIDIDDDAVKITTVDENPYPEGSIFNPVNARKSAAYVSGNEVIVSASYEEAGEGGGEDDIFSLLELMFGDTEVPVTEKVTTSAVKKVRTRKVLDGQQLLF